MTLEEGAKEGDVPVADGVADLLHGAMIAFQQALGSRDPELLQVDQRAVSGSLLEAADEITQAHAHPPGRGVERENAMKIVVQPLLRTGDGIIRMLGF